MTDLESQIRELQAQLDRQWLVLCELHQYVLQQQPSFSVAVATPESTADADLQVQRLHAQLTAAYGRIAALEEQVLNQSPHLQYR
ncbi:hypothetical protein [Synechococcus elongatus]|uniref:hypothetical protein n=1 Tax=Synechococcus elongatus TaxID=32046 RepID=UPI0030CF44E5